MSVWLSSAESEVGSLPKGPGVGRLVGAQSMCRAGIAVLIQRVLLLIILEPLVGITVLDAVNVYSSRGGLRSA